MEAYDMNAIMEAMMNDPEAVAAANELMALSAEYGAVLAMVLGVLMIALLVYGLIWVISVWRIFTKAGEKGWKAIVPFYNAYTLYKVAWKKKMFWVMVGAAAFSGIVGGIVDGLGLQIPENWMWISALVDLVCWIVVLVTEIRLQVKLAKAFGKGGGFAVGLIFLPIIFYPILAFGKAKFRRRRKHRKPAAEAQSA